MRSHCLKKDEQRVCRVWKGRDVCFEGVILTVANFKDVSNLLNLYLFQLIAAALNDLVIGLNELEETLCSKIAALHAVYFHNQERITWFGQLVSHTPQILQQLQHKVSSSYNEMVCDNLTTSVFMIALYADNKLDFFFSCCMFMLRMKFYCASNLHCLKADQSKTLLLFLRPG